MLCAGSDPFCRRGTCSCYGRDKIYHGDYQVPARQYWYPDSVQQDPQILPQLEQGMSSPSLAYSGITSLIHGSARAGLPQQNHLMLTQPLGTILHYLLLPQSSGASTQLQRCFPLALFMIRFHILHPPPHRMHLSTFPLHSANDDRITEVGKDHEDHLSSPPTNPSLQAH